MKLDLTPGCGGFPDRHLFGDVLGLSLTLGMGELFELLGAHRFFHRFGRALELALRGVATFGGQGGAGGFLLSGGFGGHR